jgi:hypothetical protein
MPPPQFALCFPAFLCAFASLRDANVAFSLPTFRGRMPLPQIDLYFSAFLCALRLWLAQKE